MERRINYSTEGNLVRVDFSPEVFDIDENIDEISICNNIKLAAQLYSDSPSNLRAVHTIIQKVVSDVGYLEKRRGKAPELLVLVPEHVQSYVYRDDRVIRCYPKEFFVTEPLDMGDQGVNFYHRYTGESLHIDGRSFGIYPNPI